MWVNTLAHQILVQLTAIQLLDHLCNLLQAIAFFALTFKKVYPLQVVKSLNWMQKVFICGQVAE